MNEFTCSEHSVRIRRSKKRSTRNQPLLSKTNQIQPMQVINRFQVGLHERFRKLFSNAVGSSWDHIFKDFKAVVSVHADVVIVLCRYWAPTSSQTSAPSKLTMVTSNMLELKYKRVYTTFISCWSWSSCTMASFGRIVKTFFSSSKL